MLSSDIPNNSIFHFSSTAMTLMYVTYTWGNGVHQQGKRKNPADYENDE